MMKISNRLKKLRRLLIEKEIDAIFISQPENRYYLSGFKGSAGFLLITDRKAILATDFRYMEQVKIQAPDYEIFQITNNIGKWFPELVSGLTGKNLGFESGHLTFDMHRQLHRALRPQKLAVKLVPVDGLVESLRAVKEMKEIELITKAVEISDKAFVHITNIIRDGMSEQQIAWELEKFMRDNGSQTLPFEIIVASGPNSALPHAQPSQRAIRYGEPIVIDMGAKFEGYCSDLSRTICLGTPDETFQKIYDIVLDAQLGAIAIIKEGLTGDLADSSARKTIERAGYGKAFGHGLGHGIGLVPHEWPRLGPGSSELLTSGMVFSIEPGIYLPGWGGVRIEDLTVIENGKIRVLSEARKD